MLRSGTLTNASSEISHLSITSSQPQSSDPYFQRSLSRSKYDFKDISTNFVIYLPKLSDIPQFLVNINLEIKELNWIVCRSRLMMLLFDVGGNNRLKTDFRRYIRGERRRDLKPYFIQKLGHNSYILEDCVETRIFAKETLSQAGTSVFEINPLHLSKKKGELY